MSKKTNIQWCDSTANCVIGCTKVSAGCASCYAAIDTPARVLRHRGIETWGDKGQRVTVKGFEKSMLAMNRKPWICGDCSESHTHWSNASTCSCSIGQHPVHRRRTFCDSNSDWLDDKWPIETLAHFLDVLRRCDQTVNILCTKRPENFWRRMMLVGNLIGGPKGMQEWAHGWTNGFLLPEYVPKNVVLLVSVENQEAADKRIPELLRIPAACRGLSLEPLLGPVDLSKVVVGKIDGTPPGFPGIHDVSPLSRLSGLGWIIIGGESGPNARPCGHDWILSLVEQGEAAGVATFVKQFGSNSTIGTIHDKKGGDINEWPKWARVQQWPEGF